MTSVGRRWWRLSLALALLVGAVAGAIWWHEYMSYLLAAVVVIAVLALLPATLLALIVGYLAAVVIALYLPDLLPFLKEREQAAPRSLVGVVGNGSIAFGSLRDANIDIYSVDPEGTDNPTRLTTDRAMDTDPAWSPDGQRIAFTSFRDGNPEIYVMKADGSEVTRLTKLPGTARQPAWSPDGEWIAFTSFGDGNAEIYKLKADGSEMTRLTRDSRIDKQPAWSPDGERIAFTRSLREGNGDIWVMKADGREETRLIELPSDDSEPSWSPDGASLFFASKRDERREIHRLEQKTGKLRTVRGIKNPKDDRWPVWAPDGGQLAFVRTRGGSHRLYTASPATVGAPERRVTRFLVEGRVSWQPLPRPDVEIPDDADNIVRLYAPLVYLHSAEVRLPMDPSEFVRRSELSCAGKTAKKTIDVEILGMAPLAESERRNDDPDLARCETSDPILVLEKGFELGTGSRLAFAGLYTSAPVYYEHVTQRPGLRITYWFFYASSLTARAVGAHQGDWERISVCLDDNKHPSRIIFHQHKGIGTRSWEWAPKVRTHPVVYSAQGSHASYPESGFKRWTQDFADEGPIWPTWIELRNVVNEPWYEFRGKWGTGGPAGPVHQSTPEGCIN